MATLPSDTHVAGDAGHPADHNAIVDVLSQVTGAAPGGAVSLQTVMNTIAGGVTSGQYLRGNGSNVALSAIQAADLPTLDQIPAPASAVGLNGKKITTLANGTASSDAAAFGQIPVIDSTASDIKADGNVAVGSTGKAADGGHIHPENAPWIPADGGCLVANWDVAANNGGTAVTAGTLYLMKMAIRYALTFTNVQFYVTSAGAGASTGSFVGLYNSSGTLLSGSADTAGSLTGSGGKTVALTSAQSLSAGTFVWIAFLCNLATTQPSLAHSASTIGLINLGQGNSTLRVATNGTGLTALPSTITPSSNAVGSAIAIWAGGS